MKSNARAAVEAFRVVALTLSLGANASAQTSKTDTAGADATSLRGLAALSVGRGLRFNNPFRLETPLGDTAESVSLSSTYLDTSLGVLFAGPTLEQGVNLSGTFALQGIGQFCLTPSYLAQIDVAQRVAARGRLGIPIVIAPDTTLGMEAAIGSNLDVIHGLGLTAEVVGSVFFGAATEEKSVTTFPMLSLQVGVIFEHGVVW